ncbi:homoserine kinase [Streptococcus gallolyticus]|jgi:homoserine kinase|uniref:Homoserine kinase n=1 Tax=Streptococcus gallolyticus TaxID=315405 RepID=A0A060RLM7_9STRE|nr:homoserine kinase [Streptococcus gallolyticus]MCF0240891.1 homoserine kinase [Streptococcus gallolyticus]MCO7177892.1 homoserine kinase [Streptococcus gallolyticus]MCY7165554.1 homoserine kinase [Streptococcus gallolyticus subsp. gallolyticus]MCY7182652.1 homoserine kinase [Streptococcus gallolyticus subsp. gallolyticus]CDO18956.1 Homoserine kinase (HK) (HSK) [Streptococcus gallolyticus]
MRITVPATSANVGPGFDSVGVAVSKYLTIEILEPSEKWEVLHDLGDVPSDETNLLITTALQVKADLQPHRIKMVSDIPLARGLGSSSSVIVAGIELANQLAHLQLSADEKLVIATKIEGHPDNVAPAIFGNLVISSYVDEKVNSAVAAFPEASFVAFIPNYELKTSDSRNVLPNEFSYKEAVAASSIANVAIAALLTGDLEKAGKAIEADLFHERFRQKLVKEFALIKEAAHEVGAYATYLSGAGPTIMTLAPKAKEAELVERLESLALDGEVVALYVDTKGVFVEKD